MVPASTSPDNFIGIGPSAQAATGHDMAQSKQFGIEYKSWQECDAKRASLLNDPVVGKQMSQARCVQSDPSPKL
jgi:hypothetical protein